MTLLGEQFAGRRFTETKIRNDCSGFFISPLGCRLKGGLAEARARLLGIVG